MTVFLFTMVWFGAAQGTVDLNLPELEYVADHLKKEDCRKLVAALHDPSFDIVNNINAAERKIPDDLSCLKLLLHWNSRAGEGRGETHVLLTHRLKQLGHEELADWLSKTVFHQLGQDLNRTLLSDPFKELAQTNETEESEQENETPMEDEEIDEWLPVDTIFCIIIIFLIGVMIFLLARIAYLYLCKKKVKNENQIDEQSSWKEEEWDFKKMKPFRAKMVPEDTEDIKKLITSSSSQSEDDEAA